MRIESDGTIVLSRRNVLALLHKLDMPGSKRQIEKVTRHPDGKQDTLVLRVEDDDVHYTSSEPPGTMHPATEAFIKRRSARTLNEALKGMKL